MQKRETIYNFRVEVVDEFYNAQYNHPQHGWVYLRTTSVSEDEDGNYTNLNVFCDISNTNEYISVKNRNLAMSIINHYKEIMGIENIKKEYFYID